MIKKIITLINKHRQIVTYLVFGVLTTAVNWAVYYPLFNIAGFSAVVSKAFAWIIAVIFAYLTNKPFVFESRDWSLSVVFPELAKFVGCRIGSGLLEILFMYFTVDVLQLNGNIMNIIISVFVVIINYIGSKLLFKKS